MAINFINTVDIINAGTSDPALRITCNDTSADAGPIIDLIRDAGNGAGGDYLGQLKFRGNNSVGTSRVYAKITGKIKTASSGAEDGLIEYAVRSNNVMLIVSRLNENGLLMQNGTGIETNKITNLGLYADMDSDTGNTGDILTSVGTSGTRWYDPTEINVGTSEAVRVAIKNLSGADLDKGDPVYITGTVGATTTLEVGKASASSASAMPVLGLCDDDLGINEQGYAITGGVLTNVTTDPIDGVTPSEGDTLYVKAGGGLTTTRPTGTGSYVQNVGKVGKVSGGSAGSIMVSSIMRTNDTPNYAADHILLGGSGNSAATTNANFAYNESSSGQLGINTINSNVPDPTLGFGTQPVIAAVKSTGGVLALGTSSSVTSAGQLYGGIFFAGDFGGMATPYEAGGILMKSTVGTSGRQGSDMYFRTRPDSYGSTPTDKMILTNDGYLGVGTTSPQEFAHFSNSGVVRHEIESTGSNQTVAYKLTNTTSSYGLFVSGTDGKLKFWDYSQNNEAMHIAPTTNRLVVNDSIETPRYVNAPVLINSSFAHTSNNSSSWYYMPMGSYPVESTSRREYNAYLAPCDFTLRKVMVKNIGISVPAATSITLRVQRYRGTALTTVWTGSAHSISASNGWLIEDFPDLDFLEDDVMHIQFNANNQIKYCIAQFVIELTGDYTT